MPRIWGSFGQKSLEETKIVILSIDKEPSSFLKRTLTLLKMSGVRNVQIVQNVPVIDETSLFIVEWDLYEKFRHELQPYAKIVYNYLCFKSIFPKRLFIDANKRDMNSEELKVLLSDTSVSSYNKTLEKLCVKLREFIKDHGRIPHLPNDKEYFNDFDMDDLIYLIESCTKFTVIESSEPQSLPNSTSSSILDEFKYSAILAAEIQKIITRKYLPSTEIIS